MADPHQPGGMSVTLKADEPGGKYNDAKSPGTWIVFHGSPDAIREDLMATFKFDEGAEDLTLHELVLEATRIFKATNTVGKILGGRPASDSDSGSAWAAAGGASTPASEPAAEVAPPTIAELIEATTSVDDLRELWKDRSDEIKAGDLVEAWKAKGASLKAAA